MSVDLFKVPDRFLGYVPSVSPEIPFVPRLSLIVPFQRNESALESTLVSVLESRTSQEELIIVHAGDYEDPYQLSRDEAVVLETEQNSSLAERLNLAARTACSPVVQVILPGTQVEAGWSEEGLAVLEDASLHVASLAMRDTFTNQVICGFDHEQLPHRRLSNATNSVAGPLLAGTMIRRRSLLKLGGWSEVISESLIDLELTLLVRTLGLRIGVAEIPRMEHDLKASAIAGAPAASPFEVGKVCGILACAYSELPESQVLVEPLVRRLGHLAWGLMNPQAAAERLGWVLGVRDRSLVRYIAQRVEFAQHAFDTSISLPIPASISRAEHRKAA